MEKILLMLTGGTICSFVDKNGIKESDYGRAMPLLIDNFKKSNLIYDDVEFEVVSPLDILSENMDISAWNAILLELRKTDFSLYKGIVIAHGTDTLAYTAAMLSIMLAGKGIVPVMLVSSLYPLDDRRANGNMNFGQAVKLICDGIPPNVYAVYRNSDNVTYIHKGAELLQCDCLGDFFSKNMLPVESWNRMARQNFESEMMLQKGELAENAVMAIEPYPGIDYSAFNLCGKKCVVHYLYHSSTAASDCKNDINSAVFMVRKCNENGIPFVMAPFNKNLLDDEAMYSSTKKLLNENAIPLFSVSREMAYSKAVIAASFYAGNDIVCFLKREINCEFVYDGE